MFGVFLGLVRTHDETFLAPATEKTKHLWKYLDDNYLAVERKQRVYDVDTHTPAGIDAFPAGYIDSPVRILLWRATLICLV